MLIQYLMFFLNISILAYSLFLLLLGVKIENLLNDGYSLFIEYVGIPVAFLTTLGVFLSLAMLISFASFYCRNRLLLFPYVCLLSVLIVTQLVVGVTFYANKSRLLSLVPEILRSAESAYNRDYFANSTWNSIQQDLECCGVEHFQEWFLYFSNSSLPDSCCINYSVDCGIDAIPTDNFHKADCAGAAYRWAEQHIMATGVSFFLMLILQIICLLYSCCYLQTCYQHNSISDDF